MHGICTGTWDVLNLERPDEGPIPLRKGELSLA